MKLDKYTNKAKRIKLKFLSATFISCMIMVIAFPWFGRILKNGFTNNYYTAYVNNEKIGSSTDKKILEEALKNARIKINGESQSMQFLNAEIEIKKSKKVFGTTKTLSEITSSAYDVLSRTVDENRKKAYVVDIDGYVVTLASLSEVEYLFNAVKNKYSGNTGFNTKLYTENLSGHTAIVMNVSKEADIQAMDIPFVMAESMQENTAGNMSEDISLNTGGGTEAEVNGNAEIAGKPDGILDVQFEKSAVIVPCYVAASQIEELNSVIDRVTQGDGIPELSVLVSEKQTYTIEYEKETEYIYNENLYNTEQRVLNEGGKGTKEIVADITYKNGIEIARSIVSETVTKEASARVIEVGTAVPPTYIKPISGGRLSSTFGSRWGSFHKGVDWACPVGTAVKASSAGTVIQAGWVNGYGYSITLKHSDGKRTRYAHLSKVLVSEGQAVKQSEKIGLSGNTGNSTGPHIHFEIIENGVQVNPFGYLQ